MFLVTVLVLVTAPSVVTAVFRCEEVSMLQILMRRDLKNSPHLAKCSCVNCSLICVVNKIEEMSGSDIREHSLLYP